MCDVPQLEVAQSAPQPPVNCDQLTKTTNRLPEPLLHKKVHSEPELVGARAPGRDFHGAPDFVMLLVQCNAAGAMLLVQCTSHHRASHLSLGSVMLSRLCRLCRIFLRFGPRCGWFDPQLSRNGQILRSRNTKGLSLCQIGWL